MDTLKMDEPIALRTRRKFKLQYPSEPRKDTILLDKTDTEMRELLICLIATARLVPGNELDAEGSSSAADINCQQVTCYRNRAALAE
jgi:hypothetical protein